MASNREYSYGDDWPYKAYTSKVVADGICRGFKEEYDKALFEQESARDRARKRLKEIDPKDYRRSAEIYKEEIDKAPEPNLPRKGNQMAFSFWVDEVELERVDELEREKDLSNLHQGQAELSGS